MDRFQEGQRQVIDRFQEGQRKGMNRFQEGQKNGIGRFLISLVFSLCVTTATKYSNILIDSNKTCCCSGTEYYRSRGRMTFFIKDLFLLGYFLLI